VLARAATSLLYSQCDVWTPDALADALRVLGASTFFEWLSISDLHTLYRGGGETRERPYHCRRPRLWRSHVRSASRLRSQSTPRRGHGKREGGSLLICGQTQARCRRERPDVRIMAVAHRTFKHGRSWLRTCYRECPGGIDCNGRNAATGKWGRWRVEGQLVMWQLAVAQRGDYYIDYAWVSAGSYSGRVWEVA
jgi:hypothetical protein